MKRSVLIAVAIVAALLLTYFLLCRKAPEPTPEKPAVPDSASQPTQEPPASDKPADAGTAAPTEPPKTTDVVPRPPAGKEPEREPKTESPEPSEPSTGDEPKETVQPADPAPTAHPPREPERRKGGVRGRVVRVDKSPITTFFVNRVEKSDPEGRFFISSIREADRVVIRADDHQLAPAVLRITSKEIRAGAVPDVVLDEGREIGGEVLDAKTREPIMGARVTLADPGEVKDLRPGQDLTRIVDPVASKAAGIFVLSHAPWGDWLLVTHSDGYVLDLSIVSSTQPVRVLLQRGGSIQGTVLGASGEPMARQRVAAMSGSSIDATEAVTDAAGKFRVGPLRAGRYVVVASQEAGTNEKKRLPPVSIDVIDGRTETVTLQPRASGATIRVKTLDARGRPARVGVVMVAGSVPRPETFSALIESGTLFPAKGRGDPKVIAGVPPGDYTLFVLEESGGKLPGLYQQTVQVLDDNDLSIEVRLPDGLPALSDPLQARFGTLSPL